MRSKNRYTDQELCEATQVAYFNITQEYLAEYRRTHNGGSPTLQEIVKENGPDIYSGYGRMDAVTGDRLKIKQSIENFCASIAAGEACAGWKIVSVSDSNSEDGFYGVLIETDSGHAIVAFRGSESVSVRQIVEDWIQADLGLIQNSPTQQQLKAGQYLDEIGSHFAYDQYAVTGHSLGGNLAIFSAIYAATEDCVSDIGSKIVQCVNFDGPGQTREFIETYQNAINKQRSVMKHYQWSLVGSILTSVCGDHYKMIASEGFASLLFKHSTASVVFLNGMVVPSEMLDNLAILSHNLTNHCDTDEDLHEVLAALVKIAGDTSDHVLQMLKLCDPCNLLLDLPETEAG
ncbi:MAG: DUF2974 domain-containing protein [Lachnospiraceae bacterium]